MAPIELDTVHYNARIAMIYDAWTTAADYEEYNSLSNLDALLLIAGDHTEDDAPKKTSAVQTWLLGYEFPSTFLLLQKNRITFLCSSSKAKILEPIKNAHPKIPVEILALPKAKDAPPEAMNAFIALLGNAQRIGTLPKEEQVGKTVTQYKAALAKAGHNFESVDVATALGGVMAIKDDDELKTIRTSANLCTTLMQNYIVPRLEVILDQEKALSHSSLVAMIEARLGADDKPPDMKVWSKGRGLADVDFASVEFIYTPVVQSQNSGFTLRLGAEPASTHIALKGVLLSSVGLKYKSYCANIARTYIVDPTPQQEEIYTLLTEIQTEVLAKMKEGTVAKDLYAHALNMVKEKKPDFESHFVKNIGHATGLEFKEPAYTLNAKNSRVIRKDMIFNLFLGFSDLTGGTDGKPYAIQLADTVKVGVDRGICLTDAARATKEIMFFFTDDPEEEKPKQRPDKKSVAKNGGMAPAESKVVGGKALRQKTRGAQSQQDAQTTQAKIVAHQKELHAKRQADGLARYEAGAGAGTGQEGKSWKRFVSYKGEAGLPEEVKDARIYVDKRNLSVILPIQGFAVPFHINTIKNANKNEEGEYTYLRINFQTPGQLTGKKEDTPFENPDATFVRSVTYRSLDRHRFDQLAQEIQALKKEVNKKEQQKKEMADVVEQDKLIEIKGRRPYKLTDVFPRPALDGKRLPGDVEIHQNGVRYMSMSNQRIEVLFSNVKHLFFQPCDNELVVLIHFHLKSPIMIGKKKTKDIQFFREATDMQFDETGNRKRKFRYGDEDEIEMEQAERARRSKMNKEFKAFAEKIADAASTAIGEPLEVDIPYSELAFEGVPYRTNVRLAPTMDCLVHLTEPPFTVVTLSEIEVASLERVQFGLKQFDLVFVFTDFTRPPLQINSIPSLQLDSVKEWLNDVDVPLSESRVNYNWGPIMKTVNEDPYGFFSGGGWSFLTGPGEASDQETEVSEVDSEYSEEVSSSESEPSESDFNGSEVSAADSDMGSAEDDEGEDWDEMERKAAKSDKKKLENGKGHRSDDDDPPRRKKLAQKNGKASGSKGRR